MFSDPVINFAVGTIRLHNFRLPSHQAIISLTFIVRDHRSALGTLAYPVIIGGLWQ